MSNVENAVSPAQAEVNALVEKGLVALEEFRQLNQEQVNYIVAKASVAALDQHGVLAMHAYEETGRGVFEDKATKNLFACEYVVNNMRHLKTVGVISENDVTGITEIADPVGVICGITPTTNPTSTAIFKSLIALKTRNPIIFAFHPSAQQSSAHAARIVYEAAIAAGAPKNCIQWIEKPSMEGTSALMKHPGIATILATGGNAMVEAAYSCGKPALGVGAGNVPAYVEKSANLKQAVHDIVMSKSFDNGMVCASEQAAIVDEEIYNDFVKEMLSYGVYMVNKKEKAMLEEFMFGTKANSKNCGGAKLNANVVGKPAAWIAEQAGFKVPPRTNILLAECKEVGEKEPLTREKLSPVLALIKSTSREDGLEKAEQMVEFHGLGHSAAIHTSDAELAKEFGKRVKAIRVIWNSPSTFGGIGDVYNAFLPSLTLGCGSYGKNSVGNNVSAVNLINIKRVGRRRNNMQWFKVPSKIYFERDSIQYLQSMGGMERVVIVTDRTMVDLGFVEKIAHQITARGNHVTYQLFADVEPDPSIETVRRGTELIRNYKPDTIIALGGGSAMDAAKVMWLFYEQPEVDFRDLVQKFMDIRKRAFKFPQLGRKARFIGIPTTSGTGSEVTPFAVITEGNKKYPIADYSLTPTVAIVDPALVITVPAHVAADTGLDVLTHATEAYVSILASDFTDGLALQAIKLVFEFLEKSVTEKDQEARERMHNASTMAGMAFANAFLGMNHSLAHKIGGRFHTPHGRTNAILMPHVIRYNGTCPEKTATWPKYNYYKADVKYQDIARMLGLPCSTPEEGVRSYAQACYDLAVRCGIKMSFKEQGLDEKAWMDARRDVALLAFEDQCSPANPRLPMVTDMEDILTRAYFGYDPKDY
ncbi:bifunctional acetaldehyde-CoA/alcohol dehydrogenase [Aggregatibacter actinomycetemcomitans]|uniref:bifunctional acetaldehyde-CoA/alcohol dehydrogenase n=1 Tax=Aggregatibacter actinomycetemcomitans TaxID=714 RepID=UPI0011DC4A92|nr:bifunctional acetaldehyde-CoA/alcohol dehydrogenase [Aggregatibacter actinomycetemcomitans]TYA17013.1 bifunctional acetaldehyde-CoA/alcohol dehydrogenase [Aggregatibacter actinomycetemcomitans]TYA26012.1 bifunctional acetaldehyde-CoA/alcohol dehydrogenase [Aggregatibacter actinomycetemcomitans]TYA33761.1 bifunctional acetaldehyde-CoA/alcohol dehydrogenase [Aggregatibacter actinomycetemcomitans]TYA90197.1 bifunctional acetaldehyde-CoA/alcohol dehydrogenase [Aggregatibacter actinomycetemcomita